MPQNPFKRSKADRAEKQKEKKEKKAAKNAKKGKKGKGKEETSKPEVPPYRHIPTHAESDALLTCPASWLADDFERIRENNRRRLLGEVAPTSAAAVTSAFNTREEYRKSLMLSPMHADNLNSMASTPMGGSSSSNSSTYHGFGQGREGGLHSSSSSSRSHHSSSPDDDEADDNGDVHNDHATRRNTMANSLNGSGLVSGRSHSSTSLRKSVHWSYGPGHLDNHPLTATTRVGASVGIISIGPAAGSSSGRLPSRNSFLEACNATNGFASGSSGHASGSNLRYGTNARSLDAELSRTRNGVFPTATTTTSSPAGPATDAAAVTSANAASLEQAMASLSLTPANDTQSAVGSGSGSGSGAGSRRPVTMMTPAQYAAQYSSRYGSTGACATAATANVAPETIAPGTAFTTVGHSSRRSSSFRSSHTHTTASQRPQRARRQSVTGHKATAAAAAAGAHRERRQSVTASTSTSCPPVSSRGPLASISAYIKSPRPVPGVSASPASSSAQIAVAANGAVPPPSGGVRRSWSRRGSHGNVGTVF